MWSLAFWDYKKTIIFEYISVRRIVAYLYPKLDKFTISHEFLHIFKFQITAGVYSTRISVIKILNHSSYISYYYGGP